MSFARNLSRLLRSTCTAVGVGVIGVVRVVAGNNPAGRSLHHNGSALPDISVYQTPVLEAPRFGEREAERRRELPRVAWREQHAEVHVAGAVEFRTGGGGGGLRVEE